MSVKLTVSWKVEGLEEFGGVSTLIAASRSTGTEDRPQDNAPPAGELLPITSSVIHPGLSMQVPR